jgi:glycosyltransferase involved in cell wall biosynthesis
MKTREAGEADTNVHYQAQREQHSSAEWVEPALAGRRLLFVINDLDFFISHRLPIALAAKDAGMDVHVAVAPGAGAKRLQAETITLHPIPMTRSGTHPIQELRAVWRLYRIFRSLRPDLVHTVTIKGVLYGGLAARMARVPALVSAIPGLGHIFVQRGARAALVRTLVLLGYRLALRQRRTRVIFQNPDDRAKFLGAALTKPAETVLIRGAGVDLAEYRPVPEPAGRTLVVFASRMLWSKGVGDFVAAAERLRAAGTQARFAMVGPYDPDNPAAVPEDQLREWDRKGVVEWWGLRDDMPDVFAQAHVICLPTSYGEGVPKVLIEAAASGRPIVATDVPGCREIVRDGVNGMLVPAGDIDMLCRALKRLIDDPVSRREMGAKGREIAAEEFSVDQVVMETLSVYRELVR